MWSGHMTVPLHVSSRASGATRFRLRLSTLVAKCHHRTPVAPYPTGRRPLIFKILVTSRLSHRGRLRAPQPHVLAHTTSAGAGRSRNQPVKNLVAATRTAARRELLLGYCARRTTGGARHVRAGAYLDCGRQIQFVTLARPSQTSTACSGPTLVTGQIGCSIWPLWSTYHRQPRPPPTGLRPGRCQRAAQPPRRGPSMGTRHASLPGVI